MIHTMTVPSRLQQPLHVDTDMNYELDMSKFPGIDDPQQMYQPALLIATCQKNVNSSNSSEHDRNKSHSVSSTSCPVSTEHTEPSTKDVLEELLNVIDSCGGELLGRLVDTNIQDQVSKTGDNMYKSVMDACVYTPESNTVPRNNIVTRHASIVPRNTNVTRNIHAVPQNTHATSTFHVCPQDTYVTSTSHDVPRDNHVRSIPHDFPQNTHVTSNSDVIPQNTHVTSTSLFVPQNTHATRTSHVVPQNTYVTSKCHVVPQNTHTTSTSHVVPQNTNATSTSHAVPQYTHVASTSYIVPQNTYVTSNNYVASENIPALQNPNVSARTRHQTTISFHPTGDRSTMMDYFSGLRHNRSLCETVMDIQPYQFSNPSKIGFQGLVPRQDFFSESISCKRKRSLDTCDVSIFKRQCYRPNTINYYGNSVGYASPYPSFHERLSNRGLVV